MPRALISVSDKTGVVALARGLAARGFDIVSTGGTARTLTDAGLSVTSVATVTGFPEMLDGRVKTLHPAVHGGILARRDHPSDVASIRAHGIEPVDVVAVNLYPFLKAASNPATGFDALLEEIDIGGPALVRAAAKNFRDVLVVVDPGDYARLLEAIDLGPTVAFRYELMQKAFDHTARYDAAIAGTMTRFSVANGGFVRASPGLEAVFNPRFDLTLTKVRDLRYGENPHQHAAWYRPVDASTGLGGATVLQGKALSYTNLLDLDAAARIVLEFDEPAAVVVKHTNPCGAATAESIAEAYLQARDADSLAAFGGIVAVNRPVDPSTAEAIVTTFIEAVIAPDVEAPARSILARKPNMRVVIADLDPDRHYGLDVRSILGAVLVQLPDRVVEARRDWGTAAETRGLAVVTRRTPTSEEWRALRFAWRISAHVKSNTVVFADRSRTLAIGAGQMSRVDAVGVAVMKAASCGRSLAGSAVASDAFFPFRDGLDAVAAAGATAVVQPGGSVRDSEVIAAADDHGLAMVFTGRRHFRH